MLCSRRVLILGPAAAALSAGITLEVAYAGSMASVMEGPIRRAALTELGITLHGRAQGANGLAQLIATGAIRPDVFISVTSGPMETVLKAGKASGRVAVARTEMVIAYNPQSRFASQFNRAAIPWWQVLEQPGLRFGRTDPVTDPQGRNIIFVMQLASEFYSQPDLRRKILGPDINTRQIFTEPSVQARLQSGQLDAASAYKVQPAAFRLPFISLPEQVNLGSLRFASQYKRATLNLNGTAYHPEPLVYYAAPMTGAVRAREAERFVQWLEGASAQAILRASGYDRA